MKTKYTANYFLKKFNAIPEEKWTTGSYSRSTGGKKCALGHCRETVDRSTMESRALRALFYRALVVGIITTNDTKMYFTEPTPKQRVMSALTLIAAGVNINDN